MTPRPCDTRGCGRRIRADSRSGFCRVCEAGTRTAGPDRRCRRPGCTRPLAPHNATGVCAPCAATRHGLGGDRLPGALYALPDPLTAPIAELCRPLSAHCPPRVTSAMRYSTLSALLARGAP